MQFPKIEDHRLYIDIPTFIDGMYSIFSVDFLINHVLFQSRNVNLKSQPFGELFSKSYDWTFHHIVTRDDNNIPPLRVLNTLRAERIRFPRHFIDNQNTLLVWNRRKENEDRYYISDENFEYLVILAKRQTTQNFTLLSAFPTDQDHYRRKLKKEYEKCTGSP